MNPPREKETDPPMSDTLDSLLRASITTLAEGLVMPHVASDPRKRAKVALGIEACAELIGHDLQAKRMAPANTDQMAAFRALSESARGSVEEQQ